MSKKISFQIFFLFVPHFGDRFLFWYSSIVLIIEFSLKSIMGVGFSDYPVLLSWIGSQLDKQINLFSALETVHKTQYIKIQSLQNKVNDS